MYAEVFADVKKTLSKADLNEIIIDDTVIQSLVVDFKMIDDQAIDAYFNSKTYSFLIDENTEYHKKTWQEIYDMIKNRISNQTQKYVKSNPT